MMFDNTLKGANTVLQSGDLSKSPSFSNADLTILLSFQNVTDAATVTVDGTPLTISPDAVAEGKVPGAVLKTDIPPYVVEVHVAGNDITLGGTGKFTVYGKEYTDDYYSSLQTAIGTATIQKELSTLIQAFENFAIEPMVLKIRR